MKLRNPGRSPWQVLIPQYDCTVTMMKFKQSLQKKKRLLQSGKYVQFERLTWLTKMSSLKRLTLTGVALTWLTWLTLFTRLTLLTRLTLTGVAGTATVGAVLAPAVATQVKF